MVQKKAYENLEAVLNSPGIKEGFEDMITAAIHKK